MAESTGTLEKLASTVGQALLPLETFFARANIIPYFAQLGAVFPDSLASDPDVGPTLDAVSTTAGGLNTALTNLANAQDAVDIVAAGADIIGQFVTLLSDLDAVAAKIGAKDWTPLGAADVAAFVDQFSAKVFEDALLRTLERDRPEFISAGVLIGIIDRFRTTIAGADPNDPVQVVTTRRLQLGRLADALSSPVTYLENLVGWGGGSLDINKLLTRLQAFLDLFSYGTLIDTSSGSPVLKASMLTASLNTAGATPGIDLVFNLGVPDGFTFTAPLRPGYDISVSAAGQLPAGLTITARPPSQLSIASPVTITLSSVLTRKPFGDETAVVLLGQTGATRLQADAIALTAGVTLKADPGNATASGDVFVTFGFVGAKAVVDSSKGDGFLQQIGPANPVEAPFQLAATWSASGGLQLTGGASLNLSVPLNLSVGPVNIPSIHLGFGVQSGQFPLEVSADLNATLGPVDVSVSRVGVLLNLSFPTAPARGNLGPAELDVRFKSPTGIGIAVDSGPISGGGFISFDEPNHRYFGALELSIYSVSVKAFGIIETQLPTGPGFSFLIIISAEFTPIQLGFGFTLLGVGGLAGINRTVDSDGLLAAIRKGDLDNILFPTDVIDNAPAILHDLETIFPPVDGHFLFGPMAKIGWGTPTLVDGELGLILELPGPRLTVLGTVHAALPTADEAVVELNLDVGGVLDFPKKSFSLDASLHDSRVGDFPVSGDMSMRVTWGQDSNFALSVGGFNPHYNPPASFPKLNPVTVDLGENGNPSINLHGYMALTSNTAQVGAMLEARVSKGGADLYGFIGFDALFIFSPFSFTADIEGGVKVNFHGAGFSLHFHGTISGPSPWHLDGQVCVSILWWDACVGFSVTMGGESKPTLPGLDPWTGSAIKDDGTQDVPGLQPALQNQANWGGNPPAGSFQVVTLVAPAKPTDPPPVDPLGSATVQQKAVPLDVAISAYAGTKPSVSRTFDIKTVTIGEKGQSSAVVTVTEPTRVSDLFAPAQFQAMKDADKLSSPSFVPMHGGFTISSNALSFGTSVPTGLTYDQFLLGTTGLSPKLSQSYDPSQDHVTAVTARSATAKGGIRGAAQARFVDPTAAPKLTLTSEGYVLAQISNLKVVTGFSIDTPVSRPVAFAALLAAKTTSATAAQTLQIMPSFNALR